MYCLYVNLIKHVCLYRHLLFCYNESMQINVQKKVSFYFLPKHLSEVSSTSLSLKVMITGIAIFVWVKLTFFLCPWDWLVHEGLDYWLGFSQSSLIDIGNICDVLEVLGCKRLGSHLFLLNSRTSQLWDP